MGAAIIDFRVCPPLAKCQNIMFSEFIDTLMYGLSSTGVTIYCYFGFKFNDNTCCEVICKRRYNDNDIMTTNKLPGMYFFLTTIIFPIQNQYKSYLIKYCMHFFSFFSSPGLPGELLPSLGVRRLSSVNFSHFKLLLRNHLADWNQT